MEKTEMAGLKVFDGTKFNVWKSSMDILFAYKKVLKVVDGTEKKPEETATPEAINAWEDKNDHARMLIMQAVSSTVMEDLADCTTAAEMWNKLRSLHQLKSAENIYMVTTDFYDYRMSKSDTIKTHINNIVQKASILKDLGQPLSDSQIITKILMSLPPGYNGTVAAWANVPQAEQTVTAISTRLLQQEHLLHQQDKENSTESAYFTRAQHSTKKLSKIETREKDAAYLKELKERTFCYNCGDPKHWSRDCPKPKREDRGRHDKFRHQHSSRENFNHNSGHSSRERHEEKGK